MQGVGCTRESTSAFDNSRYRRAANRDVAATGAGFTSSGFKYALDYPPKPVPGGDAFICRFRNFYAAGCTRASCEYDHTYCYVCGRAGHRAMDGCGLQVADAGVDAG